MKEKFTGGFFMKVQFGFILFVYAYVLTWLVKIYRGNYFMYLLYTILLNYLNLCQVSFFLQDRSNIHGEERMVPLEKFYGEFHAYFIMTTTIISTMWYYLLQDKHPMPTLIQCVKDFILFSPVRLYFSLVFDFFHYWIHRTIHEHSVLYRWLHKTHHKFLHPCTITTFYQHPVDILVSIVLPICIAYFATPRMPLFLWNVVKISNIFNETVGHCGKTFLRDEIYSYSFYSWVPMFAEIYLTPVDHDLHHSRNNCNYSKQFRLWDRVFGTYVPTEDLEEE